MKQHLTIEDLEELSDEEKVRLRELWQPAQYDLAAGYYCTDVVNDQYQVVDFVVGNIEVVTNHHQYYHLYLTDIRFKKVEPDEQSEPEGLEEQVAEEEPEDDFFAVETEPDFDCEVTQPHTYEKSQCLPLLSIGQMIEILRKQDYGIQEFFLTIASNDTLSYLGRYPNSPEFENEEICDLLWEAVKSVL